MEQTAIQTLLDWIAAHPTWAGAVVFLIAFSESLAAVGLLMPGAVLMFGVGALVAVGSLEFWPTVAWAVAGAVAGDALSFWLGRHYKADMPRIWPFCRYPGLLARGVDFFQRHGGKSVLLGRFVGPIRPIIPAVAGMLDMPPARFAAVNIASAVVWAPAYLLPGIAFGASLDLAAEVATRLAAFLLLSVALVWLTAWGMRRIYALLAPRSDAMIYRLLLWAKAHPLMGELPAAVLDPGHREARGLTLLALLLLLSTLVFVWLSGALSDSTLLDSADRLIFHALQELRTPWADVWMAAVTGMGDPLVLLAVVALIAAWLAARRNPQALGHWLAASLAPFLMVLVLRLATLGDRAPPLGEQAYAFPSAHATLATAIYGFLAVLLAREMRPRWRPLVYSLAGVAVAAIGFSRLFLGAHWFSDVLGGTALGLAWVALIGMAYRRHFARHLPARRALAVVAGVLLLAGSVNGLARFPGNLEAFQPRQEPVDFAAAQWWAGEWAAAPAFRSDMRASREHPLDVQWAGSLAAIRRTVEAAGWRAPDRRWTQALQWLRPRAELERLPVLPQVHAGRHEELLMVRPWEGGLLALRLWPADVRLQSGTGSLPLWLGSVTRLEVEHPLGLSVLRTQSAFDPPLRALHALLGGDPAWDTRVVQRELGVAGAWDGRVLLARPAPETQKLKLTPTSMPLPDRSTSSSLSSVASADTSLYSAYSPRLRSRISAPITPCTAAPPASPSMSPSKVVVTAPTPAPINGRTAPTSKYFLALNITSNESALPEPPTVIQSLENARSSADSPKPPGVRHSSSPPNTGEASSSKATG